MFFVLKGQGIAHCDGKVVPIQAGDSILVPPSGIHVIENIGSTRLYTLCIMVPNEDFAELIRSGTPVALDEEDLAVLGRRDRSLASTEV
jgi:mannose-6-phosphate isomerase-like protein (cupin superfamily)